MMMKKKISTVIGCCLLVIVVTSCNDFLDITPTGKVIAKTAEEYRAYRNC